MAGQSIPYSSNLAQQMYRSGLILETERTVRAFAFAGTEPNNAIVVEDRPGSGRGNNIKIRFRATNHNRIPKPRGVNVLGTEDSRPTLEDDISLRYFVMADGAVENLTDQMEVDFELIGNEQIGMAKEAGEIFEKSAMNQLCGYTPVNDTTVYPDYAWSGGNIVTEPDAAHWYYCPDNNGSNADEAAVAADSNSILTNRVVDEVTKRMRSLDYITYPIAPAAVSFVPGGEAYLCLASGDGMQQVRSNSSDSDVYDLSKAAIQGGLPPQLSNLVTGEGFFIGKTLYIESDFCTFGTTGTAGSTTTASRRGNCKRAVILGARAMHLVWGESFTGGNHLGYKEMLVYRRLGMISDTVYGLKAVIVNGQRWGSYVISHYSPVA